MKDVCTITVDKILETTVIGDSLITINDNFSLLSDITCAVTERLKTITVRSSSIASIIGIGNITVSAPTGLVEVAETFCPTWYLGQTNLPLYQEPASTRISQQITNWKTYKKHIDFIISQNPPNPGTEYIEQRVTGVTHTGPKHSDTVMLGDGRIFFVPDSYNKGVIYDPVSNKFTITAGIIGTGFVTGHLLPDGRVCMVPGTNSKIYFWDPRTNSTTTSNVVLTLTGLTKPYNGGVMLADGRIMLIPYERTDGTLIYDPVTDTTENVISSYFNVVNGKGFYSGVLLYDGSLVIMIPYASKQALRVETQPPYNVYPANQLGSLLAGNSAYSGGVLLPNGRVFFIPYNANAPIIYDPVTDTYSTSAGVAYPGNAGYVDGFVLPDGRVCMPPYGASKIAYYDPFTNITSFSSNVGSVTSLKYSSGVTLEDGTAIFAPSKETNSLTVQFGGQQGFPRSVISGIFY